MKRLSTVIGILTAAVISGHAQDYREARLPVRSRDGLPQHARPTGQVRNTLAFRTKSLVPVAIDSETGEPYCISAAQARVLSS